MTNVTESPSLGEYAVAYARAGWAVLPTWWIAEDGRCACGQCEPGSGNAGKHPITELVPSGLLSATTSTAVVTSWWGAYPRANVAVACRESGLVVIDVDPRHGGDETWAFIESKLDLPAMPRARTSGGGLHLYLRDSELRARVAAGGRAAGKLGAGVDVKWNGYVLAPPSRVVGKYSWEFTGEVPVATGELLEAVLDARKVGPAGSGGRWGPALDLEEIFAGVPAGERHSKFVSYAASLRARRVREVEARQLVETAWAACDAGDHPFPLDEALRILHDLYDRLPEGTTGEVQLEAYAGYIKSLTSVTGVPSSNGDDASVTAVAGDLMHAFEMERLVPLLDRVPEVHHTSVMEELRRHEVRIITQQIIQTNEFIRPPDELVLSLADQLALPRQPKRWAVEELAVLTDNALIIAQYKAGKTTLGLNLVKSFVDDTPFLGRLATDRDGGVILMLQNEMATDVYLEWCRSINIRNTREFVPLNLRGYSIDIMTDVGAEYVREQCLRYGASVLIIDPYARSFYGDENSNTEAKLWTDRVDRLKMEAGVSTCFVLAHTGRAEALEGLEHVRGATRLEDWCDVEWIVTRGEGRELRRQRFIRAHGRNGDFDQTMLVFNPDTFELELSNVVGSRVVAEQLIAGRAALDRIREAGACTRETALRKEEAVSVVGGNTSATRKLIDALIESRDLEFEADGRKQFIWASPRVVAL